MNSEPKTSKHFWPINQTEKELILILQKQINKWKNNWSVNFFTGNPAKTPRDMKKLMANSHCCEVSATVFMLLSDKDFIIDAYHSSLIYDSITK